ncbi:MAG: glutamine--tRNA ligase, partial [Pseudomonadales bacterium]
RGFPPAAIRHFCDMVGVTRSNGIVDVGMLESAVRDDLEQNAKRAMCVREPLKVTIENFGADETEMYSLPSHPKQDMGQRAVPFTQTLYIEKSDFSEDTSLSRKKFQRLVIGDFVRLRGSYVIKAERVIKDDSGDVVEVVASLVAGTVGNNPPPEFKPRGVIHWVSAEQSIEVELRIYDRLFTVEGPDKDKDANFVDFINPDSLQVIKGARAEPSLASAEQEQGYQFERTGYFVLDEESAASKLIFNQTLPLKAAKR